MTDVFDTNREPPYTCMNLYLGSGVKSFPLFWYYFPSFDSNSFLSMSSDSNSQTYTVCGVTGRVRKKRRITVLSLRTRMSPSFNYRDLKSLPSGSEPHPKSRSRPTTFTDCPENPFRNDVGRDEGPKLSTCYYRPPCRRCNINFPLWEFLVIRCDTPVTSSSFFSKRTRNY